jgi:hypothetical protein
MQNRLLTSFAILAYSAASMAAQSPTGKPWTAPLARDGHPDLEGNWLSKSATPLERPKQLEGRQSLTDAEVAEMARRAERIFKDGHSDAATGDNVFLAALADTEVFKSATATNDSTNVDREFDNRTSLITDPPDGKIPPYTPAGRERRARQIAATLSMNNPASARDLTAEQRCITFGVPRLGGNLGAGIFGAYQIVQTRDHVVFYMEAVHEARIIPLDGRAHVASNVRTWEGDSRGRWEGNTLVVDTTNFSASANYLGAGEDLHLTERFTRVAPDELRYEITLDAPNTWTQPWSAMLRLKRTDEKMYEFACHEGNAPTMETMLAPRAPVPAEEAAKKH